MKIYAKVLARRLNKYLGKLIHCDQTGFVKGHFSSDNLRRLLYILHFTPDCSDLLTSYGILLNLLIGGRPAAYPIWLNNGIHILGQLFSSNGLHTFEDLKEQYNLCRFSRFLYFQLHAAMKTYGVPWNSELPKHDLTKKLYNTTNTRGTVSALYTQILQASYKLMATILA